MEIREQFEVAASPQATYRQLSDVGGIGHCVAGVEEVVVVDDDRSRWTLQVRAGFMALTVTLDARILERREPELIGFTASGQDVTLNGRVALSPSLSGGTLCELVIEAKIGGPLGPVADLMARGPQEQMIAQTVANIREQLSEVEVPSGSLEQEASLNGKPPIASRQPMPSIVVSPEQLRRTTAALGGAAVLVLVGFLLGRRR